MRGLALALALALPAAPAGAAPDLSPDAVLRDHLWRGLINLPPNKRPKVGLVLSAGSLRAVAHVGVISVLEDAGFPIDVVSGTSMGAILGALYAGGHTVKRPIECVRSLQVSAGSNMTAVSRLSLIL